MLCPLIHQVMDVALQEFAGLRDHIINNLSDWREYATSSEPHRTPLPGMP